MDNFSEVQLDNLKAAYAGIEKVDPDVFLPKLHAMFAKMNDAQLAQIAEAEIKFVSKIARNEINRRKA